MPSEHNELRILSFDIYFSIHTKISSVNIKCLKIKRNKRQRFIDCLLRFSDKNVDERSLLCTEQKMHILRTAAVLQNADQLVNLSRENHSGPQSQ